MVKEPSDDSPSSSEDSSNFEVAFIFAFEMVNYTIAYGPYVIPDGCPELSIKVG